MDFFEEQSIRKWQSIVLLVGFIVAMLVMALLINAVITVFSMALGQSSSLWNPSAPAMAMIGIVWLTIIAGGFFRALDVRAGGAALARRFGAQPGSSRSHHEQEKTLLNIVAEVSIAATTAQPEVYVLRNESSVNAFVLGTSDKHTVIVVTQGALDAFDRDELQAVIAHEFGHVVNGDLPLNMRLLIVLGGLMAIDEVGRSLCVKGPDDSFHPGVIVGALLIGIGSVGVLFGKLIQAAFSRQREFLADASSVQFTRNPAALASALSVIKQRSYEPALHSPHCQELAHLCFQTGSSSDGWYQRLLTSHPTLQSRIDAIDPHFAIKRRKKENSTSAGTATPLSGIDQVPMAIVNIEHASAFTDTGSLVLEEVVSSAPSDRIVLLLSDDNICLAALFALFAGSGQHKQQDYMDSVAINVDWKFASKVRHVLQLMPDELSQEQLCIINHATEQLNKHLSATGRSKVLQKLEQLIIANDGLDLIGYATLQLIRRKLEVEHPVVKSLESEHPGAAQTQQAKSFDSMAAEFALLLSLMVEASGASPSQLDEQFQRVLKCYTLSSFPRRTASEPGIIEELQAAFQTLYVQPESTRKAFVQHCIEIMQHDGFIMPSERSLLDLFAASLCCEELIAA